jgi:hypothetical protein
MDGFSASGITMVHEARCARPGERRRRHKPLFKKVSGIYQAFINHFEAEFN